MLVDRLARWLQHRTPLEVHEPGFAQAAVTIVLTAAPGSLLLVRRAVRGGDPWSGQIGLPGGRRGQFDRDLLETAVRETREEVGLDLRENAPIGQLDDLRPLTPVLPPVVVRPYVFLLPHPVELALDPEIAQAWWVPLGHLLGPGVFGEYEVEAQGRRMIRAGYRLEQGVVWGMTERILSPLLAILRQS
jgi:8-oxo-dGTP pyrophosphatase MutT (NUDIX family)